MTTKAVASKEAIMCGRYSRRSMPRASRIVSNGLSKAKRRVPLFIPSDQAYYWSNPWQRDAIESMRALQAGEFKDFDSDDPTDVAKWLLSVDEDDCD